MAKAFLQIILDIKDTNREAGAGIYSKYKDAFLTQIEGSVSKELLIRDEDVQVLHGFDTVENAQAYLSSKLFENDVVRELTPLLEAEPEVRIYVVA